MSNKILIMENDPAMCENIAELLSISGYEVSTSYNGKDGLAKAIEFNPGLILCDIMMPELDGYGVLSGRMNFPNLTSTPIVLLTAMSENKDRMKALACGAAGYLVKPFSDIELLEIVSVLLNKKSCNSLQAEL